MKKVCFFGNCGIISKEKIDKRFLGGKRWQKNMFIYLVKATKI